MPDTRLVVAVAAGVVLGGVAGAVAGAQLASWTGGLIGAYGGILCGMCVVGGLVAIAGAVTGYWLGTPGIPRVSPLAGFFAGLILPGSIAGLIVDRILGDRAEPAVGALLLFGPTGAGFGAWVGTVIGSPVVVAIGLVVGSLLGFSVGHLLNVAADKPAVSRYRGGGSPWSW